MFTSMSPHGLLASENSTKLRAQEIDDKQTTPFELYLTANEAYAALKKNPSIVFLDVRDPIEITFVGHPEPMDINIPISFISRQYDSSTGFYKQVSHDNFVKDFNFFMTRSGFEKSHPIIIACREGHRAARASKLLYDAGYQTVWHQVAGFQGSTDPKTGIRNIDESWVGAGLPVRFKIKNGAEWRSSTE